MSDDPSGPLEEARQLLEAEADRRGIGVEDLVDRLSREGRRTGLTGPATLDDLGTQDDLARWITTPPWAGSAGVVVQHGAPKTAGVEPAEDFDDKVLIFGTTRSGKTSGVDLVRAQLELEGVSFEETVRATDFGDCFTELRFQRPDGHKE
ncbi:hypothetical protein ACFRR6_01640 [Streptomyces sp. NPDC056891]|uniref:hypothetical protein n=1 Tax=Streptomyces sp. NPDC056891 TaxID=3345961 RepID=UPI0036AA408E